MLSLRPPGLENIEALWGFQIINARLAVTDKIAIQFRM